MKVSLREPWGVRKFDGVIKTKRWNDETEPDDGYRLLVCRYRPRGVLRADERWDAWLPQLGPSKELHAAVYGKNGDPIEWSEYEVRYRIEMEAQRFWIRGFAERTARGEMLTLLCSSACDDPARCHRTILAELIGASAFPAAPDASRGAIVRRGKR